MKRTLLCVVLLLAAATAAPLLCLLPPFAPLPGAAPSAAATAETARPAATPSPTPALVQAPILLWDEAEDTILSVSVPEYLIGAAACEMPANWPDDALRAQMVASHSYALYCAARADGSHEGACLTVNTAQCSGYATPAVLQSRWGGSYAERRARLEALAAGVQYAVLLYDNAPAMACYHAISCGHTEASGAVWNETLPYLAGVDSAWDTYAEDYEVTVQYARQQFRDALALNLGLSPEGEAENWVGPAATDAAGYVQSIRLAGQTFTGTEVRSALSLRSACFAISYADGMFAVTTRGFGHGVGLSQYGACAMAQGGTSWQRILAYYFPGTTLGQG